MPPNPRPGPAGPAFKDQFSVVAADYLRYRPTYPGRLFAWLADLVPGRTLAWDCATGSGQAAIGLVEHFDRVVGTDASAAQLTHARAHPRIEYREARADASGLADRSAALITVAQALHWIELEPFWREVRRVARPGAVIAVWCYSGLRVEADVDEVVDRYYRETVGAFWAPERQLVDQGYRTLAFPFDEVTAPAFAMTADWTLPQLEGYLRSWSATANYRAAHQVDPVALLHRSLRAAWGNPVRSKAVTWPLHVRAGRVRPETGPVGGA